MEQILYTLYDRVAQLHKFPRFYRTAGDAIRACSLAVKDPQTELGQFPKEFELFEIGTFNDLNGKMLILETPKRICLLADLLPRDGDK